MARSSKRRTSPSQLCATKGLDPENDAKTRADFVHRVTLQLNSLYREGTVEKIGSEMEACAKAAPDENAEPTTVLRALFGLAGSIVPRCR